MHEIPHALPAVNTIAQAIQLSLSPIFMLAGSGTLLNVLAGRLSRVIDRARDLEARHPRAGAAEKDRHIRELRLLDKRMTVINRALTLVVASAVMTCFVVAIMFVAVLFKLHMGTVVAVSFILAMVLLIAGLISFLVEVHISLTAFRIRPELLEAIAPPEA